jgi:hypothetical protein
MAATWASDEPMIWPTRVSSSNLPRRRRISLPDRIPFLAVHDHPGREE